MALNKLITLPNGASGSYWKIVEDSYIKPSNTFIVVVSLFLDKAHADIFADLGVSQRFELSVTKEEMTGDRAALAYTKIKQIITETITTDLTGHKLTTPRPKYPDLIGATDA